MFRTLFSAGGQIGVLRPMRQFEARIVQAHTAWLASGRLVWRCLIAVLWPGGPPPTPPPPRHEDASYRAAGMPPAKRAHRRYS